MAQQELRHDDVVSSNKENLNHQKEKDGSRSVAEEPADLYFDSFGFGLHSDIHRGELCELEERFLEEDDVMLQKNYVRLRNKVLQLWVENPNVQVTFKDVIEKIPESKNLYTRRFLKRIFDFLDANSFINFGIFNITKPRKLLGPRRTVCVIGAGISGIVAARQLKYFGFDVFILEAGKRTGGRIYTIKKEGYHFELGASLITKVHNNPVLTIIKQKRMHPTPLKHTRKLFVDGELVERRKDKFIEAIFLKITKLIFYLYSEMEANNIYDYKLGPVSLEKAYMVAKAMIEISMSTRVLSYITEAVNIKENVNLVVDKMRWEYMHFLKMYDIYWPTINHSIPEEPHNLDSDFDYHDQFDYNELKMETCKFTEIYDHHTSFLKTMKLEEEYYLVCEKFEDSFKDKLKDIRNFFSIEDLRILDWHFAVLECLLGAPLAAISAESFGSVGDLQQTAPQIFLRDGYESIMHLLEHDKLANGPLNIEKSTAVKVIELQQEKVNIIAQGPNRETKTYSADAVLCTLPLGVLKRAVDTSSYLPPNFTNKVTFSPPLPADKVSAINRLGFGVVNKVVLGFERKFWGDREHMAGNVPLTNQSRGEMILFMCTTEKPILTAIIGGHTAINMENEASDDLMVTRCVNVLREMFLQESVPPPKFASVSRWGLNPLFLGTHSYTAVNASKDDYDTLALPVSLPNSSTPRLFFAGEHTCRQFPGTVHGAFLSGLSSAAMIRSHFDSSY